MFSTMVWHLNSWDYKITLSQGIAKLRQIGVKKLKREGWELLLMHGLTALGVSASGVS